MRYALISDIHSNLIALNEVLDSIKDEEIDAYICCGDIVGYGPWPNECVQVIKDLEENSSIFVVVGNHDWAALELEDVTKFNEDARKAVIWTKEQLSKENKEYIKELPYLIKEDKFTIVHGSPRDPLDEYVSKASVFKASLKYFENNLCFIGHTHVPLYFYTGAEIDIRGGNIAEDHVITLDDSLRYMINIGSVGQPRDGDSRACYGIFDDVKKEVVIKRVSYDIKKVQSKMKQHNLPASLISRLQDGE